MHDSFVEEQIRKVQQLKVKKWDNFEIYFRSKTKLFKFQNELLCLVSESYEESYTG